MPDPIQPDPIPLVPATPAPDPARWYAQEALVGSKVRLVPLTVEHAEGFLSALWADDGAHEIHRWLGSAPPTTVEQAREEIRAALAQRAAGQRLPYAQLDADTARFIGTTSYYDVAPASRALAIGYTWLGTPWWRTGHNTEAKLLLLSHAFQTLGAARVVWHTDVLNERSRAAIGRLGASLEGVLRKHRIRANGSWRDSVQFAMTDEDWPAAQARLRAALNR